MEDSESQQRTEGEDAESQIYRDCKGTSGDHPAQTSPSEVSSLQWVTQASFEYL